MFNIIQLPSRHCLNDQLTDIVHACGIFVGLALEGSLFLFSGRSLGYTPQSGYRFAPISVVFPANYRLLEVFLAEGLLMMHIYMHTFTGMSR